MNNIKIKAVEIYHPENTVNNEYYLQHFDKQKKDIKNLLDAMGRNNRYVIDDNNENALTMGIKSAKKVLEVANLKSTDIDMIVFSTQTPEYTFPTNAIHVHRALQGKHKTICFDMNSNCAGMVVAVEQLCRYMKANSQIKYALLIGSDYNSFICKDTDEITYSNYGDASSAIILERTNEEGGFIDSDYYTDSMGVDNIVFPACGLSNIYNNIDIEEKKLNWIPFDGTCSIKFAIEQIKGLMEKYKISNKDVGVCCFSQFSAKNIELMQEHLSLDKEKFIYLGDEYGYTGTSSPFIALHRAEKEGKIKKGDYVFFWSVGAGWQICTVLFQY